MTPNQTDIETVIIGGGQAGLAVSYLLTEREMDHVILERSDQVASAWKSKWDSFTLVTPNWQLQLPGFSYEGDEPDGFLFRDKVVSFLEEYTEHFNLPMRFGSQVTSVEHNVDETGYVVKTLDTLYTANNVIVATGSFHHPHIPECREKVSPDIRQMHSSEYQNPEEIPDGGVLIVGSGQSGCQIAQELHEHGRRVFLSTGSAGRLPRRYRGKDCMYWAEKIGIFTRTVQDLESPEERFAPNPHVSGKDGGRDINLHQFARDGITLLGHLRDVEGDRVFLADDLHENLTQADQFAAEFCNGVDNFVEATGMDAPKEDISRLTHGFDQELITELNLGSSGISTILWATGFDWDWSWIDLPLFDEFDYPIQNRGITDYPGLYFIGLRWQHTLKSSLFYGVGDDARHLVKHLAYRRSR